MLFCNSFLFLLSLIHMVSWLPLSHGRQPMDPFTLGVGSGIKEKTLGPTEKCIQKDTCTCVRKNRTAINLHFLNTGSKPRFNISSPKAIYQWNPCTGFKAAGIDSVSVAAGNSKQSLFVYGIQTTARFNLMDGIDVIDYIGESGSARVVLKCNEKLKPRISTFSFIENQVLALYEGPCTSPKESSLSYGSMILITLLVLIVVYFTIGFIVNTYIHKAVGRERIPNYESWSNLPSLIKDGFVFIRRKKGYQNI